MMDSNALIKFWRGEMPPCSVASPGWHQVALIGGLMLIVAVVAAIPQLIDFYAYFALVVPGGIAFALGLWMRDDGIKVARRIKADIRQIGQEYDTRKRREPDLRRWEFFIQMLCSAYFSWRWLGGSAGRFRPFSIRYWAWLAQWSSLSELEARASLAAKQWREQMGVKSI